VNDFICIGGGISGISAAHLLSDAGLSGLVLEKSRGLGGRMSTRKLDLPPYGSAAFDHGAQFFTLKTDEARTFLSNTTSHSFREWLTSIPHDDYPGDLKSSTRYVGIRGMSFPIPQALALIPSLQNVDYIKSIEYRPCIAVLLCRPLPFDFDYAAKWPGVASSVEWICDNQKKGISELPSLTLHLNEACSRNFFESPDSEIFDLVDRAIPSLHSFTHLYRAVDRWKYSQPKNLAMAPDYYFDPKPPSLLLVGDGFSGGRVEGALLSGLHAAKAYLEKPRLRC